MAYFEESFFEGEEREGFYVEPMMKRAWAAQIEVLEVVDAICKKHNITYYADWGTLLGAVRHKGFVPWDDDMDIVMKREEYQRFLRIANAELPEGMKLNSIYTDKNYNELSTRVVNSVMINYSEEFLKRWHGCPYVVGIDIFPLDSLPLDKEDEKMQRQLVRIGLACLKALYGKDDSAEKLLQEMESLCGVSLKRNEGLKNQLLVLIDGIRQMFNDEGGDYSQMTYRLFHPDFCVSRKAYDEVCYLPFENIKIPVPAGYDEVLRAMYGDYLIPVRGTLHDYPFYKKQQEIVDKKLNQK